MYKIKTEVTGNDSVAVIIPSEILINLGISAGDEIEVTEADNALILRSTKETERISEIADATENVFNRWNNAFIELAKGADDK